MRYFYFNAHPNMAHNLIDGPIKEELEKYQPLWKIRAPLIAWFHLKPFDPNVGAQTFYYILSKFRIWTSEISIEASQA